MKGRVEIWSTRYRHAHDGEGEAWITIDKTRIRTMGTLRYYVAQGAAARRIQEERGCTDFRNPEQSAGYYNAWNEANRTVQEDGIFGASDLNRSLFAYLNLSIEDALESQNPIIQAFGLLDKRFGKRRLAEFDPGGKNPLVVQLYLFRCGVEGVSPRSHDPQDAMGTS